MDSGNRRPGKITDFTEYPVHVEDNKIIIIPELLLNGETVSFDFLGERYGIEKTKSGFKLYKL